ncbi:CBS domain-containing protein [Sphingobacterium sp. lm-10]|uniref:CBS domain-containing protein n=1 Tax=Sphingobacterium sp. lm-10 TaxID=2944904 RepID=UPI00202098C2|nr:CBS domain-containing protein [Sphingobacterium sp. lm-10]MCL7987664.1 CBS domain-containing protein [Sphingobacterium sp. lm-10]
MYIGEIISNFYAEVSPQDTVAQVLHRINEFHFHQLPIVQDGDFIGLVREENLLAEEDETITIGDIKRTSPFVYVYDHQHIFDGLQMMAIHDHDILPVLNKDHKYIGIISQKEIIKALNHTLANNEAGAVIVLEMDSRDYTLSQVSHIIESENTRILSISSRQLPDSDRLEMTIKVNKNNIAAIVASLWRFDYVVKATFNDGSDKNDIQDRYNLLMNYLEL